MPEATQPINVRQIVREIEDEVRRRRQSGELPAELERDLDMIFAQYAPVGAVHGDFDQVVARVEKVAFIDVAVPTGSNQPGVSYVKRGLKKGMAWYLNYVAQQVSSFAHASTRALRILGERVERIEHGHDAGPGAALAAEFRATAPAPDLSPVADLVVRALDGVIGRVVHGDAGAGSIVAALRDAGLDAYAVEPLDHLGLALSAGDTEVRIDELLDHLQALPEGSIGGIVLSGCVDRAPLGDQLELARLAADGVAPGGRVVVIASTPSSWAATNPVLADLAGGHPLHAETWAHLLRAAGLDGVDIAEAGDLRVVTARRPN